MLDAKAKGIESNTRSIEFYSDICILKHALLTISMQIAGLRLAKLYRWCQLKPEDVQNL